MSFKMPQVLDSMNLYVGLKGYAGRVEQITLPKLTIKTEEVRMGGMDAPVDLDHGMEKLECSFTLAEYDNALFAHMGLAPGNLVNIFLKGSFSQDGEHVPVKIELLGSWKEIDMGEWKPGERVANKITVNARYYALMINNLPIVLIDIPGGKRIISGVDKLKAQRDFLFG